jgi:hypothetical protein
LGAPVRRPSLTVRKSQETPWTPCSSQNAIVALVAMTLDKTEGEFVFGAGI